MPSVLREVNDPTLFETLCNSVYITDIELMNNTTVLYH